MRLALRKHAGQIYLAEYLELHQVKMIFTPVMGLGIYPSDASYRAI